MITKPPNKQKKKPHNFFLQKEPNFHHQKPFEQQQPHQPQQPSLNQQPIHHQQKSFNKEQQQHLVLINAFFNILSGPSNQPRQQPRHLRRWKKEEHHKKTEEHHKKKKPSKHKGIAYIRATFSNTFITVTDYGGNKRTGSSSGCLMGFKGSRRSTKYAAKATAENVARAAIQLRIRSVEVRIKGIGLVRKRFSLKGLKEGGLIITKIRDVTQMPHNGCRPPKKRRV